MKRLLKGADVLAGENGGFRCLKNGYLGIDGDRIDYIGVAVPKDPYDEVRDMTGKLLLPGLINGHTHTGMSLLRGLGSDLPLDKWLFDTIFPVEDRLTDDDLRLGMELAMLEMLASGTTSFTDMYMGAGYCTPAILSAGMKANLCRPLQSFDPEEEPMTCRRMKEMLALYEDWNGAGEGRIRVDFSIHAEYTCTEKMVRAAAREAEKRGAGMHLHLSETESEQRACVEKYGMTPARWFDKLGAFDLRAYAAHGVWLTAEDRALLKERGVTVVHCPESNLKLGSGVADVPALIREGVAVALGTDGPASNNNLNLWEEMHLVSILHKGVRRDPTLLSPQTVLSMATVNGAKLQGREDTGVLAVGNKADIVAIDMDRPHLVPAIDPISNLVYSAQGADVVMTMVDGRILYENGEYLTLDRDRILFDARRAARRLLG
ncbi:MAG: amidohydrolase [Clostridia bacterium]|nr:amidohydrolase [Clostridia bacterium]